MIVWEYRRKSSLKQGGFSFRRDCKYLGSVIELLSVKGRYMVKSISIIALPLIILGIFLCGLENLLAFFDSCRDRAGIVLFLEDDLTENKVTQLHKSIASQDGVKSLEYLAKEDVLARFAEAPDLGSKLEALGGDPIPHLFEIKVSGGLSSIKPGAELLASFPGVEEVDYGKEKLDRLIGIQAMAELIAMAVGILLILVLLSIISQCFGLLFLTRLPSPAAQANGGQARRSLIEPLRLNHLLAQGSSAGLLGGVFATILLFGVHSLLTLRISAIDNDIYGASQILFISWPFILELLISGAILGCLGTLIAWRSTGRMQTPLETSPR